jgi:hypothetical protein
MSTPKYDTLKVLGLHEPDVSIETDASGNNVAVPLPGNYTVGVEIGGVFMPIQSFKAGNFLNADGSPRTPVAAEDK